MKTINFSNIQRYQSTGHTVKEERVDEFLGALLMVGLAGMMASKATLSWWNSIQEIRANIAKHKEERAQSKTAMMQEKTKQLEEYKNRMMMMFGNTLTAAGDNAKDPAGNDLGTMNEILKKASLGTCNDNDIKQLAQFASRKATPEEDKLTQRMEDSASKYTIDDINKYCEEHGVPKNADINAITKMMDSHEEAMKLALPPKSENKNDDELRQEIRDKLKDAKEGEIPPSLKTEDGKLNTEKIDKSTGDDLVKLANDCGVDPIKPQKSEEKPEGETNKEGTEEDEPQDGDERTDNDDDIEDADMTSNFNIDTNHPKKDPRKVYKKRHYKRGDKTFTTKNYYNKHGISITPDEYQNALSNWDKKKKKNEGWGISKLSTSKHIIVESKPKSATDRIGITKERLVYIRYVMDTTTKSIEKVAMERMYNALFDLAFNADGTPRSLKDLYSYLDQTMIENKGKVPGLPNETQIENIDEKVQAFKKLHIHEYDAYIKRLDKELLDKSEKDNGDDAAADLLHPDKDETDAKTIDDIRQLSTIYGFTNILGLEPERKPNQKDDDAKAEIDKQLKDGSPDTNTKDSKDVKADDISDEQIDKIIGVSK